MTSILWRDVSCQPALQARYWYIFPLIAHCHQIIQHRILSSVRTYKNVSCCLHPSVLLESWQTCLPYVILEQQFVIKKLWIVHHGDGQAGNSHALILVVPAVPNYCRSGNKKVETGKSTSTEQEMGMALLINILIPISRYVLAWEYMVSRGHNMFSTVLGNLQQG